MWRDAVWCSIHNLSCSLFLYHMKGVPRVSGKYMIVCSMVLVLKACFRCIYFHVLSHCSFLLSLWYWYGLQKSFLQKENMTLLLVIVESFQHKNSNFWFQICIFFVFISFLKTNIHFTGLHLSTMYESVCNSHWSVWTLPEWARWDRRKTGASWPPSY